MSKSLTDTAAPSQTPAARAAYLGGLSLAVGGAVLFSCKAIVAKLLYRYQIDAVTLIAFRMLFSLPVFAAIGWWQMRKGPPLSRADRWRLVGLGLIGYYLSSFLDFLGLQYISVGLERLILFLTPTFVLLLSILYLKQHIQRQQWIALCTSYAGIVLVFLHDLQGGARNVALGSALVLGSAISYALYLLFTGEMVKRLGSLRLVSYAMCVSSVACITQFFVLRPASLLIQPAPVYWLSLVNG
ncbi:MAG: DMT family transporter, partial [Sphingomonadaceae bacterium]